MQSSQWTLSLLGITLTTGLLAGATGPIGHTGADTTPGVSHKYLPTATATAGSLAIGPGNPAPPATKVTASNSSPSVGHESGVYEGDLPNGAGKVFATKNLDLLTEHAQVSSDGTSSACSAAGSGACGQQAPPLDIALNLKNLAQLGQSTGGQYIPFNAADSLLNGVGLKALNGYTIVLGITGPSATCTAGPAGDKSDFTVSRSVVTGTIDLQYNGKSVIGGPTSLSFNGDLAADAFNFYSLIEGLEQVSTPSTPSPTASPQPIVKQLLPQAVQAFFQEPSVRDSLNSVSLNKLVPGLSITVTSGSDSGAGTGPSTSAQVGSFSVSYDGIKAVTLTGGSVSCGPNTMAPKGS